MNKRQLAYEAMILLGVLALLSFITRLWPILLCVMLGILICAVRLLFIKARTVEVIAPTEPEPDPEIPETELSIVLKAFSLLQRRITERIAMQYPDARWIWGVPNAIENFKSSRPLIILLNSAGGFQKAHVRTHNLMFVGLYFGTPEQNRPESNPEPQFDAEESLIDDDDADEISEDVPVNYGRIAFEWVDANMTDLNTRYNEAIAQNETEMIIAIEDLPHPDSYPDICEELKRNGFSSADACEDGICVKITG